MKTKTDFRKAAPARERCIVKVGQPGNLRECGAATEYGRQGLYAGYYHKDKTITDHGAVPGSWI